ncbi:MAG: transketolase family protein [Candidatus Omnitrophica bacterium]|nr:transketolase family protein [Candidatus Omnitrophota bacterium]
MNKKQDRSDWKPTRDGYGKGLVELGKANKDVVVLSADLTSSTRANWFKKEFPDRFFSFGIAEQDMMSTAAGFALSGKIPYCCTFGVFASGRAWDQLRVSVSYMDLNVNIGGSHGGVMVGPDGATHQALEEISLMRVIPNMQVVVPCDILEAEKATIAASVTEGPVYIRLGREKTAVITKETDDFKIGKADTLKEGKDLTIIACGTMVYHALVASESLEKDGIDAGVINLHTIKPIDAKAILEAAGKTGAIVTAEEHLIAGGMGSAVAEIIVREKPVPIEMVGIEDRFGESGSPWGLMEHLGLMPEDIVAAAKKVLKRKRS